jgi:predicted DCC family thiol-disulfide oxidoreductase YuxK
MNGLAIYYSSRLIEFYRFPTPYIFEHLWTIKLMTWGTLVIEFALGALLWIKELRYWILLAVCTRSVDVLRRLDALHRIRFLNMHAQAVKNEFPDLNLDRGASEFLLRAHDGKWFGGFDAYRVIAKHMPAFWLILPLLFIPPVPAIGRRLYARIAGRRYCILPPISQASAAITNS